MNLDPGQLTMTDAIRPRTPSAQEVIRRLETKAALVFPDLVGSKAGFARFADTAGRQLQHWHPDLPGNTISKIRGTRARQ